jgi:hypothetical protein
MFRNRNHKGVNAEIVFPIQSKGLLEYKFAHILRVLARSRRGQQSWMEHMETNHLSGQIRREFIGSLFTKSKNKTLMKHGLDQNIGFSASGTRVDELGITKQTGIVVKS